MPHPTAALLFPPHPATAASRGKWLAAAQQQLHPGTQRGTRQGWDGHGESCQLGPFQGHRHHAGISLPTAGPRLPRDTAVARQGGGGLFPPPPAVPSPSAFAQLRRAWELQKRARPLSRRIITHEKALGRTLQSADRRELGWSFSSKGTGIHASQPAWEREQSTAANTKGGAWGQRLCQNTSPAPRDELRAWTLWTAASYGSASLAGPSEGSSPSRSPPSGLPLVLSGQPAVRELTLDLGAHVILHGERWRWGGGCAQRGGPGQLTLPCPRSPGCPSPLQPPSSVLTTQPSCPSSGVRCSSSSPRGSPHHLCTGIQLAAWGEKG